MMNEVKWLFSWHFLVIMDQFKHPHAILLMKRPEIIVPLLLLENLIFKIFFLVLGPVKFLSTLFTKEYLTLTINPFKLKWKTADNVGESLNLHPDCIPCTQCQKHLALTIYNDCVIVSSLGTSQVWSLYGMHTGPLPSLIAFYPLTYSFHQKGFTLLYSNMLLIRNFRLLVTFRKYMWHQLPTKTQFGYILTWCTGSWLTEKQQLNIPVSLTGDLGIHDIELWRQGFTVYHLQLCQKSAPSQVVSVKVRRSILNHQLLKHR